MHKILLIIFIFSSMSLALAQDEKKTKKKRGGGPPDGFTLGAGMMVNSFPYIGVDANTNVIPAISYKKGRFWIRGPFVSYQFYKGESVSSSLILRPDLFGVGYEAEDSPFLAGMEERKGTVNLGASVSYKARFYNLSARVIRDVIGRHNGLRMAGSIGTSYPISLLLKFLPFTLFSLNVGPSFYDKRYANYFFGVRDSEALSVRPAYTVGNIVNAKATASLMTKFTPRWTLRFGYEYERVSNKMFNSPIIGTRKIYSGRAFLTYRF